MNKLISLLIAVVLLVPVVGLAQVSTSTLPDPGTLPDSPFYFLKSWREGIQLFFTFSAEKKAAQYLHLAEVRLAEYEKMIEKALQPAQGDSVNQGRYEEIAKRTLEKYESQLERALAKAEELKEEGEEIADELKEAAEEAAEKHLEILERNLEKVSESAKKGIQRALEASRKQLEKLDDIFDEEFEDPLGDEEENDIEGLGDLIDDKGLENELDNLLKGLE